MCNHNRDIRASGKFQKIWPRWGALGRLHECWTAADHLELMSENVDANFQIDIIFINKLHIWTINKHILTWKPLKTTFRDTTTAIFKKIYTGFGCPPRSDTITNCETAVSSDITLILHSYQPIRFEDLFFPICIPSNINQTAVGLFWLKCPYYGFLKMTFHAVCNTAIS